MRLTPLDQDVNAGRKYLNERSLQSGHVLPLSEEIFKEYFPEKSSFLLYSVRAVDALFSFRSGREKWTPRADFVIVTDSLAGLKEAVGKVEDMALAQEKLVLRTRIFGYDRKRLQALRALDSRLAHRSLVLRPLTERGLTYTTCTKSSMIATDSASVEATPSPDSTRS